jgi:hypothetical protein
LGFTKTLNISKMPLLNMHSTVSPISGAPVTGGSVLVTYNTDNMNWPTLASQSGFSNRSQFEYQNLNGTVGVALVKHSIANIRTAAGASTVS